MGFLDLSDADTSGFDPIPPQRYEAEIYGYEHKESGETSKVPGTPMLNIQFRVTAPEEFENRRVFRNYMMPGDDYPEADKAKKMKGMLVSLFEACGFTQEEIMSGTFEPDLDELVGKKVLISVKVRAAQKDSEGNELYPAQNDVSGVKAWEEGVVAGATGGLL